MGGDIATENDMIAGSERGAVCSGPEVPAVDARVKSVRWLARRTSWAVSAAESRSISAGLAISSRSGCGGGDNASCTDVLMGGSWDIAQRGDLRRLVIWQCRIPCRSNKTTGKPLLVFVGLSG